ncbi:MAG: NifB/NifX family molybdenum-iron cluster-binding protein [Calditrichaeota bacterium]|nr:NifB/NifX family molybdenum-iron cluster-binding protein [Candidatus Cloacimonadota bacterium]MCA9787474.1 NifB/NifX family molybdenum-iron cluster-binding protein [Candidatus Cloacimonadota bacterium]MCB1048150.1 NifB/NifX family molybdenum-iron cluster-binding protein [Calditrichota bacterium]MCB9473673.1 NifB/NifX family molybdenum-iron cluster-binding protein [Candidatus Delongbacteria bacterium]
MKICVPINADNQLDSEICAHFGSAPAFLIVDTEDQSCHAIVNGNQHHQHGKCMPLQALQNERIEGVVVGGIGNGALSKLTAARLQVYISRQGTVRDMLVEFRAGRLGRMEPALACAHDAHGHV